MDLFDCLSIPHSSSTVLSVFIDANCVVSGADRRTTSGFILLDQILYPQVLESNLHILSLSLSLHISIYLSIYLSSKVQECKALAKYC
jgi:hypothetical protein